MFHRLGHLCFLKFATLFENTILESDSNFYSSQNHNLNTYISHGSTACDVAFAMSWVLSQHDCIQLELSFVLLSSIISFLVVADRGRSRL